MRSKLRSFFYGFCLLGLMATGLLSASPTQAAKPGVTQQVSALTQVATIQSTAEPQTNAGTWASGTQLLASVNSKGITLRNPLTQEEKLLPLPTPGGPGRDVLPWVVIPWQLSFSPSGQLLLLVTMEGYENQGADYFRLWVLNLDGQVQACTDGNGINQANWITDESILFFDYEDPTLTSGAVWLWNWRP